MSAQRLVTRQSYGWKEEEVAELAELIKNYPVIAVFDLTGTRANIIHEMRQKLRDTCVVRVAKKTLFNLAAYKAGRPDVKKLLEGINKPVGFIFSKINSFKLSLLIDQNKVPMHARAGERADFDIWVPETNTGLPPGPVLSDFGKLKIPTRIEGGQIWIAKDTLVAKKGEEISHLLASLLVKLDIKAVLRGLALIAAYEDGVVIKAEDLKLDLDAFRQQILEAAQQAINIAVSAAYVTPETIKPIIMLAARQAMELAIEAGYADKDTIKNLLLRAELLASALAAKAGFSG
ncbi:MAG: 50S ribosomal protein L10 [Aigarchaeota archaeon]|nr:50S ribosomal protein L10 [Candidatus Pelearchaeum maunauluense]